MSDESNDGKIAELKEKYPELFADYSEMLPEETIVTAIEQYEKLSRPQLYDLIMVLILKLATYEACAGMLGSILDVVPEGKLPKA